MTRRPYIVVLKEPGRGRYEFNTVARSEAEALRIARTFHPRWHHVQTVAGVVLPRLSAEAPSFPSAESTL